MPADQLKTLSPGDDSLSSATWNQFVAATRIVQGTAGGGGQAGNPPQATVIRVRNDSGSARDRFDVLGLEGPVITPADNLLSFLSQVCLSGVIPAATHAARFCVLQEPVPAGMIGRAAVAGVSYARVRGDDSLGCADVTDRDADALTMSASGSVQVLADCGAVAGASGAGAADRWAVVRFGNACVPPSSGSGPGSGGGLVSGCTPDCPEVPAVLYYTRAASGTIAAFTVTLVWNAATSRWEGSGAYTNTAGLGCSDTANVRLFCGAGVYAGEIQGNPSNPSNNGWEPLAVAVVSCIPFSATVTGVFLDCFSIGHTSTAAGTITETHP